MPEPTEGPDYISPSLWPLTVRIDTVRPLERNPRKGDVEAVKRSLIEFKQRKPIVAQADGTIIAGNHTHAAAVALGWQEIAVVFEDDDPVRARAFALADNRTADLGRYDNELLAASLVEVREADASLLDATNYSSNDVDDLLSYLEGPTKLDDDDDFSDDDDAPDGEDEGPPLHTCPACGHQFE